MQDTPDIQLLSAYVDRGEQDAFARIVQRHIDWIRAAARRLVRDSHAADDVGQAVFLVLARRKPTFPTEGAMVAWLFKTTRFAAANYLKSEHRRRRRERLAAGAAASACAPASGSDWSDIAPLLDHAIGRLGRSDQRAILLRFFRNRSLAAVGEDLGISEDAAKKRLTRALGRLRDDLTRQGVTISAGALAAVVTEKAVEAAPAGLANSVVAGVSGANATGAAVGLAIGAMHMMAWARIKVAAALMGVALLPLLAAVGTVHLSLASAGDGTRTTRPSTGPATVSDISADHDARQLLAAYRESLGWLKDAAFTGETRVDMKGVNPTTTSHELFNFEYAQAGKRFAVRGLSLRRTDSGPLPFDPELSTEVRAIQNEDWAVDWDCNPGKPPRYATGTKRFDAWRDKQSQVVQFQGPLDGVLNGLGGKTIADLLEQSGDLAVSGSERIGDETCVIATGSTAHGTIKMWLSPSRKYAALKYSLQMTSQDLFDGRPLSSHIGARGEGGGIKTLTQTLDDVRVEAIDGVFVVTSGRLTSKYVLQNGRIIDDTWLFNRSNIKLHPDLAASSMFQIDLPEGTPLYYPEFSSGTVGYEWRHGTAVPWKPER